MLLIALLFSAAADEAVARAQDWAKKAKPIAECASDEDCAAKWQRATDWVRKSSRFQVAVDQPNLFATYGAVYANTDLSFVLEKRARPAGGYEIAARAWCGNVLTCKPKPKAAIAELQSAIK